MAPQQLQPEQQLQAQRSVCFAEERNVTHWFLRHEESTPDDQWLRQEEFDETKRILKRKVQEWKMRSIGVLLRNTFDNPHPTVQRNINAFVQLDDRDCVRGVERSLSCNLDQKVTNLKRRCIKTVLSHQRIMRRDNKLDDDQIREELAVVSKMQSRPCVHFARRLAKADELATRNDDVSAAYKLVEELNTLTEIQKPQQHRPGRPLGMKTMGGGAQPRSTRRGRPRSARIA